MELMELHEKIAAMRTYIAEHGLCKWEVEDKDGQVCIVGAAMKTGPSSRLYEGNFLPALAIELGLVGPYTTLENPFGGKISYPPRDADIAFNNHPDTTENDMLEFLHIAEIRAKELI